MVGKKSGWLWNIMLAFPVRWLVIIFRPCYNSICNTSWCSNVRHDTHKLWMDIREGEEVLSFNILNFRSIYSYPVLCSGVLYVYVHSSHVLFTVLIGQFLQSRMIHLNMYAPYSVFITSCMLPRNWMLYLRVLYFIFTLTSPQTYKKLELFFKTDIYGDR